MSRTIHVRRIASEKGGWVEIYADGRLVDENHYLSTRALIEAIQQLGVTYTEETVSKEQL